MALYDKGDCVAAAEKLGHAHDLVHVPTLALYAGRCLERLGRLVEASEWYRLAGVDPADAGSEVQTKAQAEAATLRAAVEARIATVVLSLARAAPDAEILLDGQLLPQSALGIERPIDPGHHHAEVRRGRESAPVDFALEQGEHRPIVLESRRQCAWRPSHRPLHVRPPALGSSEASALPRSSWVRSPAGSSSTTRP